MKDENSIDLPMEIWQKIFRFLDKKCRKNATLTCRKWFKIIRHDTIQSGMDLFISGQNTLKRSSTNYRLQFIKVIHFFINQPKIKRQILLRLSTFCTDIVFGSNPCWGRSKVFAFFPFF